MGITVAFITVPPSKQSEAQGAGTQVGTGVQVLIFGAISISVGFASLQYVAVPSVAQSFDNSVQVVAAGGGSCG